MAFFICDMNSLSHRLDPVYRILFGDDDPEFPKRVESVFVRKGLDLRRRLLCAVSALTAGDQPKLLRVFLHWSLGEGVDPAELYEVILQSYLFAGYPAAIEGFFALRDVLQEEQITLEPGQVDHRPSEWKDRGLALCGEIYGKNFHNLQDNIERLSPELGEWMIVEGYGKVLSRAQLGTVERELCTVAALTVMNRRRQLLSHIKGALNVGARMPQIREAIIQTSLFSSRLFVLNSLELLQDCCPDGPICQRRRLSPGQQC